MPSAAGPLRHAVRNTKRGGAAHASAPLALKILGQEVRVGVPFLSVRVSPASRRPSVLPTCSSTKMEIAL